MGNLKILVPLSVFMVVTLSSCGNIGNSVIKPDSSTESKIESGSLDALNARTEIKAYGFEGLSKDFQKVYYNGKEVVGADPVTFESLNYNWPDTYHTFFYFKDRNHVYDENLNTLTGADSVTFKTFENTGRYAIDANNVYVHYDRLANADAKTFTSVGFAGNIAYGKDAKNVYCNDQVLAGADVTTFAISTQGGVSDKNHQYEDCEVMK